MAPLAALARRRGHAERYVLADVHAPGRAPCLTDPRRSLALA